MNPQQKLYRLKYIENGKVNYGAFAKLSLILHRLDQLLESGMYCIAVDDRDVEYKPPKAIATPKQSPSKSIIDIDAIAAYLSKPENVARRRLARLDDEAMWAKLRNLRNKQNP